MIDDLIAFSRLGRQPLKPQPVKLDDLVHQIIEEQRADREVRRIEFSVGKLGMAGADLALVKQALATLLNRLPRLAAPNKAQEPHSVGAVADAGLSEEGCKHGTLDTSGVLPISTAHSARSACDMPAQVGTRVRPPTPSHSYRSFSFKYCANASITALFALLPDSWQ